MVKKLNDRLELFKQIIDTVDESFVLLSEYDEMPHLYGNEVLYQSESQILQWIGKNPNGTVKKLAQLSGTSASYCSQTVQKMRKRGFVEQTRNELNNREYLLNLTSEGKIVFESHEKVDNECYERNCKALDEFSNKELKSFKEILSCLNNAFKQDISRSNEKKEQGYKLLTKNLNFLGLNCFSLLMNVC